jgi:hypothetical protein
MKEELRSHSGKVVVFPLGWNPASNSGGGGRVVTGQDQGERAPLNNPATRTNRPLGAVPEIFGVLGEFATVRRRFARVLVVHQRCEDPMG